jgi:hypothetical protein
MAKEPQNHCHCGKSIRKGAKFCPFHTAQSIMELKDAKIAQRSSCPTTVKASAKRTQTATAARELFLKRQKLQKLKAAQ